MITAAASLLLAGSAPALARIQAFDKLTSDAGRAAPPVAMDRVGHFAPAAHLDAMRYACLAMIGLALFGGTTASVAMVVRGHAHHRSLHRHRAARRTARAYQAAPYGAGAYNGKPDCRYPNGTPFDPDIIGGPNHVGAGGPAVNLGGFDPCGY